MSQQLPYHHQPTQYVHYSPSSHVQHQVINGSTGIAPQVTTTQQSQPQQQQPQPQSQQLPQQSAQSVAPAATAGTSNPLVATGDWTKDLVHLAKTAELKKHALTLQLHTAHILSAHASLQEKGKVVQDLREQRNKLESERAKLLDALRQINEDRDKADIMMSTIERECHEIRTKMNQLTEGEYAVAKNDVDRLRHELGQPPLPSLQATLDEKSNQYLNERRLGGSDLQTNANNTTATGAKRDGGETPSSEPPPSGKRPRGRPKGSKNRSKDGTNPQSGGVM